MGSLVCACNFCCFLVICAFYAKRVLAHSARLVFFAVVGENIKDEYFLFWKMMCDDDWMMIRMDKNGRKLKGFYD